MKRLLAAALLGAPVSSLSQQQPTGQPKIEHAGKPDVKVWVNTKSGVYHCPGTRLYGNTKQGEYMTQSEAQDKGYRPAYGTERFASRGVLAPVAGQFGQQLPQRRADPWQGPFPCGHAARCGHLIFMFSL